MTRRIFIDMDGPLADFDTGYELRFGKPPSAVSRPVMWQHIWNSKLFFESLPMAAGAYDLVEAATGAFIGPVAVLTAAPKSRFFDVAKQKHAWLRKYGLDHLACIPAYGAAQKPAYMQARGDILIDDRRVNIEEWEAAGGVGIKYESAKQAIRDLSLVLKEE